MKTCKKCGKPKTERPSGKHACKPCEAEYQRNAYKKNPVKLRERKRLHMAKSRQSPETRQQYLGYQRKAWRNGGSEKRKLWMNEMRISDQWRWKALTIHTSVRGSLSGDDLQALWLAQNGLCGLTGRKLEFDDMQLDHKMPRSRGGDNSIENLRWVCKDANQAKHGLTDEEFVVLCSQVAEFIGRQIMEACK
jgi:5-methylcytosine-specific restriction endonuclease McrA